MRRVPEDAFMCRQKVSAYRCCRPRDARRRAAAKQRSRCSASRRAAANPGARRISTKTEAAAANGNIYTLTKPLLRRPIRRALRAACPANIETRSGVGMGAAALRIRSLGYLDSRLMVLTAWFGPRQPKN